MLTRRRTSVIILILSLIALVIPFINNNRYLIEYTATLQARGKEEEQHEPLHVAVVTEEIDRPTTESAPRPKHLLPYPPAILDNIKSTNSSQYTWLGNQYVPPEGVPVFTPSQIKDYFQNINVLFIGDSTAMRAWWTVKNIINAEDLDNIPFEDVHINRKNWTDKNGMTCENTGSRSLLPSFNSSLSCANMKGSTAYSNLDVDNTTSSGQMTKSRVKRKGLIDFMQSVCHHNILWHFNSTNSKNIMEGVKEDYDLVIVGNGIWEYVNSDVCGRKSKSGLGSLPLMLDTLRDFSSKDIRIVVRSPGFAQVSRRSRRNYLLMGEFVNYSLQYFHNLTMAQKDNVGGPKPNMTLVDFGSVIYKRSFHKDRIEGDHIAHYGYEARTLFVQQLMHELVKAELEN
eukprot:scaffold951_cov277-Chaetoceros_neogracile.AAC.6